jgi:hypothetical protein
MVLMNLECTICKKKDESVIDTDVGYGNFPVCSECAFEIFEDMQQQIRDDLGLDDDAIVTLG